MKKEETLRSDLGIPPEAQKVIFFAESSHWDPNWVYTSQEYYDRFVQKQLDQALACLQREPRRIYSVECMFFLRMYWERNPHQQAFIREFVNNGRMRLTSSGITTADTLIPNPEAILRDLLLGQEWLRANGMNQEPQLAYFSDSFGCSPALPSLLKAAGFQQTAITRVDGMYFPGFERHDRRKYPRPGSTAEHLLKTERTLDFIWRDHAGAEMLCHWNAYSYGQGDLLAHRGFSRNYMFPVAISDPSERNVARRIRRYVDQLAPFSRTPYLLCPIGFDFVPPIANLVALLDRYNKRRYPTTGVWAVNAGLDDYLNLVDFHRERLPVIELDPNPYWSGFYNSRPALKQRCHRLVDELILAEELSQLPQNAAAAAALPEALEDAWWTAAVTNHHDFITGTSPDRVVDEEQVPWLEDALDTSSDQIEQLAQEISASPGPPATTELPQWSREHGKLRIRTANYVVVLAENAGGCIVTAEDPVSAAPLLSGLSNDLISYKDSGGLWRMGFEYQGGIWSPRDQASSQRAELAVLERNGGLEVSWTNTLGGQEIERSMWFHLDSPLIFFRLRGLAPKRHSMTVSFSTGLNADELLMDTPGGVIARSRTKIYSPTFWPFQRFFHVRDRDSGRGVALYQELPGAASFTAAGQLELVALRNTPRERAYHILPVPGNPAKGYEKDNFTLVYAIEFTSGGDWVENELAQKAHARTRNPWADLQTSQLQQLASGLVVTNRDDVWAIANKPATRGAGRIVRLYTLAAPHEAVALSLAGREVQQAFLCDARERDIQPLEVRDGQVHLTMPGTLASVRLIAAPS